MCYKFTNEKSERLVRIKDYLIILKIENFEEIYFYTWFTVKLKVGAISKINSKKIQLYVYSIIIFVIVSYLISVLFVS